MKKILIAWGPECIDGIWTIDYIDSDLQRQSIICKDAHHAHEEWESLKKEMKQSN